MSLLSPKGWVLIRIPVAESLAWSEYREHWAHLDAPRHLFLHTRARPTALARQAGLRLAGVEYDSTPSQFVLSELYRRDIAGSSGTRPRDVFNKAELRRFARRAQQANRDGMGDMAVFYLTRGAARGAEFKAP